MKMKHPISLADLRKLEFEIETKLARRYSKKLERRLHNLRLKIERRRLKAVSWHARTDDRKVWTEW